MGVGWVWYHQHPSQLNTINFLALSITWIRDLLQILISRGCEGDSN